MSCGAAPLYDIYELEIRCVHSHVPAVGNLNLNFC